MRSFWRAVPLFFSAVPAAILLLGLVRAFARPEGVSVPAAAASSSWRPPASGFFLLALGDSLTRGRGDPGGEGYVGAVAQSLRKGHPDLKVENLAVDGLESEGLKETLSHPNALELAARANLVLISIGGNDLTHSMAGESPGAAPVALAAALERFERNLDSILSALRGRNAAAPILLLSLYNPASSPTSPASGSPGELGALASSVIIDWNASLERIAVRHGARVVPIRDLFEGHPDRLSSDHFHPDGAGYRLIAGRALEQL